MTTTVTGLVTTIVTFDLDSTLCDTRHRRWVLMQAENEASVDWRAYAMECRNDAPIESVQALAWMLSRIHDIWVISSRHEDAYDLTHEWLREHQIPFHGIVLKGRSGKQTTYADLQAHKVEAVREIEAKTGKQVLLHVDDSQSVADALLGISVPTLVVTPPGTKADAWVSV